MRISHDKGGVAEQPKGKIQLSERTIVNWYYDDIGIDDMYEALCYYRVEGAPPMSEEMPDLESFIDLNSECSVSLIENIDKLIKSEGWDEDEINYFEDILDRLGNLVIEWI